MADDSANEDSWLYGDSNPEPPANTEQKEENVSKDDESGAEPLVAPSNETPAPDLEDKEADEEQAEAEGVEKSADDAPEPKENGAVTQDAEGEAADATEEREGGEAAEEGEEDDDDDDDSDDDDVQVTIGDIKTSTTYTSINLKRGLAQDKNKQPGKFSIEEFEAVGTISGVPAHEFNLDSLEDKPWRKPGADITDYFNYGFNEDTWRAYCEKQKRIRIHDSGVGLMSLGGTTKGVPGSIPVQIINDNSKYSGLGTTSKAGPPPGRKFAGTIDVIGGNPSSSRRSLEKQQQEAAAGNAAIPPVQENPIQVMTADRREYGRKPGFPDLSVPPPTLPPFDMPPPPIDTIPSYTGAGYNNAEFYPPEADPYYQSYEPTQDLQWGAQPWEGGGGGPVGVATNVVIPLGGDNAGRKPRTTSTSDKQEEAPVEKERERHRESRHRHRSRSRSPERSERASRSRDSKKRNKSRSRSPHRHRSKKKSRRERDESD